MAFLVTGGCGFIGSNVVGHLLSATEDRVVNVDRLTYAGNRFSLRDVESNSRYTFIHGNIADQGRMLQILREHRPEALLHFAAETHVDRSIDGPRAFLEANVMGTFSLLQAARTYWQELSTGEQAEFRFLHVSTDEVYGSLGASGKFTESSPYRPRSPYAASKAASDHLARAWQETYGLPVIVTNCSNNYGPFQFPEKLIPLSILKAIRGEAIPVYGQGENIRDWLYVQDHAAALHTVLSRGRVGDTYNIGGGCEQRNIDVVRALCRILDQDQPRPDGRSYQEQITFVPDRPGHDFRYAIDSSKIQRDLSWQPQESFESGLRKTVDWYLANRWWWEPILNGTYRMERLGAMSGQAKDQPQLSSDNQHDQ